jgi:hypothetical protein
MSTNTAIREGGKPRVFGPVRELKVKGDDNTEHKWVPERDRNLTTKFISKNGVYSADQDDAYAYSNVSVNVSTDSVTGTDPDTGETTVVRTDPDTGELVWTVVPTSIQVIAPPNNPSGIYTDGQTIIKDGMVVKAYDSKGNELMTVPNNEISLTPTTAVYDESIVKKESIELISTYFPRLSEYIPIIAVPNKHTLVAYNDVWNEEYTSTASGGTYIALFAIHNDLRSLFYVYASENPFTASLSDKYATGSHDYETTGEAKKYTAGTTVYYYYVGVGSGIRISSDEYNMIPDMWSTTNFSYYGPRIAWELIYGNTIKHRGGCVQTITVSWPRPGDHVVLETSFDIQVESAAPVSAGE